MACKQRFNSRGCDARSAQTPRVSDCRRPRDIARVRKQGALHQPAPNRPRPSSSFSCSIQPFRGRIPGSRPQHPSNRLEVFATHEAAPCGLLWQPAPSKLCEPLWNAITDSESGVPRKHSGFLPQSKRFMASTHAQYSEVFPTHEPRNVLVLRPRNGRSPSPHPSPPGRGCPRGG